MNLIKSMVLLFTLICCSSTHSNASPHGHSRGWGCPVQRLSCGWDGITSWSPCDVPSGTGIKCYGFCPCPPSKIHRHGHCIQARNAKVCGSDGITYPNACYVPLNIQIRCDGVCPWRNSST